MIRNFLFALTLVIFSNAYGSECKDKYIFDWVEGREPAPSFHMMLDSEGNPPPSHIAKRLVQTPSSAYFYALSLMLAEDDGWMAMVDNNKFELEDAIDIVFSIPSSLSDIVKFSIQSLLNKAVSKKEERHEKILRSLIEKYHEKALKNAGVVQRLYEKCK